LSAAAVAKAAALCLLGLLSAGLLSFDLRASAVVAPQAARPPVSAPPPSLLDGDLVFRRGRDVVANIVLAQTERSRFSHVGVVIRQDGQWFVAHAMPADDGDMHAGHDGVRIEPLAQFNATDAAEAVGYFRIDALTPTQRQQVSRYVQAQRGKPFDYRFSHADDSAFYCTELALKALSHAGLALDETLERVQVVTLDEGAIAPDALRRSPRLRELSTEASSSGAA
jgi:hypothetical protein